MNLDHNYNRQKYYNRKNYINNCYEKFLKQANENMAYCPKHLRSKEFAKEMANEFYEKELITYKICGWVKDHNDLYYHPCCEARFALKHFSKDCQ